MPNLKIELEKLLQKDKRLLADGKLIKKKLVELAHKSDKDLLKLLIKSKAIKKHFFEDIECTLVFDKVKFQDFINPKELLADSCTKSNSKIGLQMNGDYMGRMMKVRGVYLIPISIA